MKHDSKPLSKMTRRSFLGAAAAVAGGQIAGGAWRRLAAEEAGSGGPWQIGCYTRPFDQHEPLVALDAIAEAGYRHAGLMTAKTKEWVIIHVATPVEEAAKLGEEVRKRGLTLVSVYAGEFPVAESVEAGIRGLRRLIDNCAAAGSPGLLLAGIADEALYKPYFKVVGECCAYAAEKKVVLSIKPHGGKNATGPQCREAVELVGQKNFRLWYDPGNIFYYSDGKLDPVDDAPTVDGLVCGMSVKDYRHPKEVLVTPGTGKVNFPAVLARLRKGGFERGPLVVECVERGELKTEIEEARKARRFLEELMSSKQAGTTRRE